MAQDSITFSGDVPARYDKYRGPSFEQFALDLVERLRSRTLSDVLEIACGTGRVTRLLRATLPDTVRIVATDISVDMMDFAQNALTGERIEWQRADSQSLPFKDRSFDLVICQFGYMFADDKQKAMQEAYRVLRRGGSLLFNTWDAIGASPVAGLRTAVITEYLGGALPISDVAHSMSEPGDLEALVTSAGFIDVSVEKVTRFEEHKNHHASARAAIFGGPILNHIQRADPEAPEVIVSLLAQKIEEVYGPHPRAEMSALVTQGWKK